MAAETRRLAQAARTGKLTLPELEGGTFTVSTLGSFGIDFFTPVITPGQVAILGVGRLRNGVRWEGRHARKNTGAHPEHHLRPPGRGRRARRRVPASVAARLATPLTLLA